MWILQQVCGVYRQLIFNVACGNSGRWTMQKGEHRMSRLPRPDLHRPLYTAAERQRRDASPWTLVQGILAPFQFAVFLVSLGLVFRYLATGEGFEAATISIIAKTLVLYTIMVTGSIWEHDVYGKYLFADAFFWEDAVSMVVIALHTLYLVSLLTGWLSPSQQMWLALAAYATYVVNAVQFILKLRAARLGSNTRPLAGSAT
jgi:3-vinyl bacteriochlorophyllide hydratase